MELNKLQQEKEKQEKYLKEQKAIKEEIKKEKHAFWKLLWFYFKKPFRWIIENIKDWRTFLIFVIVYLLLSSEVWIFYILGVIFRGTSFGNWAVGVASACWLFWLGPLTPFLPLCIVLTGVIKKFIDKFRFRKLKEKK